MIEALLLSYGDKLVAYNLNKTVCLKKLESLSDTKFKDSIKETIEFAKEANLTQEDINSEIKKHREEKKIKLI